MTSVRDISRIITKARTRDEEQSEQVQRDGEEPPRERLLPELRRRRAQVRGQQPLEGLTRPAAPMVARMRRHRSSGPTRRRTPSAATARAGDRARHRAEDPRVDPRQHRRHHRGGVDHRAETAIGSSRCRSAASGVPLRLRRQHARRRPGRRRARSPARSSARPKGSRAQGDGQGRRSARRRLLRDRRHPRRAHRHHVRGPRAARPRAQGAPPDRGRPHRRSARATAQVGIRIRLDKRRTVRERAKRKRGAVAASARRRRPIADAAGDRRPRASRSTTTISSTAT